MSYHYSPRTVTEDRDLTRAAAERYLMLQALSERQGAVPASRRWRLATYLQALRARWQSSSRTRVTAEQGTTAK